MESKDPDPYLQNETLQKPILDEPLIDLDPEKNKSADESLTKVDSASPSVLSDSEPDTQDKLDPDNPISGQAGDDSDDDLDSDDEESLLGEIINSHDSGTLSGDKSVCSDEDAAHFRSRLRAVGIEGFVREYISSGKETAKKLTCAFGLPPLSFLEDAPDEAYYKILGVLLMRELSRRQKLPQYNTFDDAVSLIEKSRNILVITGAGVTKANLDVHHVKISTNLGIPDFRSKNTGFYAQMREEGFEDPQDIFALESFDEDPRIFYRYAYRTLPDGKDTTPTHAFIKLLQDRNQLLTNYTQNIDNIEGNAGLRDEKVIQCHGSWASFTCRKCGFKGTGDYYYDKVRNKVPPDCPSCVDAMPGSGSRPPQKRRKVSEQKGAARWGNGFHSDDEDEDDDIPQPGKMKPDITFFGEKLPDKFFDRFKNQDIDKVDLIIVIGTSMKVAPVSEIPLAVDKQIPQIFISRELTAKHVEFDVVLLGDCDVITSEIAERAHWDLQHPMIVKSRKIAITSEDESRGIWRFKAADGSDGSVENSNAGTARQTSTRGT